MAHNYAAIYRMYNFDWDPEPGTVQYKIDQRIRRVGAARQRGAWGVQALQPRCHTGGLSMCRDTMAAEGHERCKVLRTCVRPCRFQADTLIKK